MVNRNYNNSRPRRASRGGAATSSILHLLVGTTSLLLLLLPVGQVSAAASAAEVRDKAAAVAVSRVVVVANRKVFDGHTGKINKGEEIAPLQDSRRLHVLKHTHSSWDEDWHEDNYDEQDEEKYESERYDDEEEEEEEEEGQAARVVDDWDEEREQNIKKNKNKEDWKKEDEYDDEYDEGDGSIIQDTGNGNSNSNSNNFEPIQDLPPYCKAAVANINSEDLSMIHATTYVNADSAVLEFDVVVGDDSTNENKDQQELEAIQIGQNINTKMVRKLIQKLLLPQCRHGSGSGGRNLLRGLSEADLSGLRGFTSGGTSLVAKNNEDDGSTYRVNSVINVFVATEDDIEKVGPVVSRTISDLIGSNSNNNNDFKLPDGVSNIIIDGNGGEIEEHKKAAAAGEAGATTNGGGMTPAGKFFLSVFIIGLICAPLAYFGYKHYKLRLELEGHQLHSSGMCETDLEDNNDENERSLDAAEKLAKMEAAAGASGGAGAAAGAATASSPQSTVRTATWGSSPSPDTTRSSGMEGDFSSYFYEDEEDVINVVEVQGRSFDLSTIHHTAPNGVNISEDNIRRVRSNSTSDSDLQCPTAMARRTSSTISASTPEPTKLFDNYPNVTVVCDCGDDEDEDEDEDEHVSSTSSDNNDRDESGGGGGEKSSSISVYTENTARSFLTIEQSMEVYEDGRVEPAKKERKPKRILTPKQQQLQRDITTPTTNRSRAAAYIAKINRNNNSTSMRIIGKTTPVKTNNKTSGNNHNKDYENDHTTSRAYSVPDTVAL